MTKLGASQFCDSKRESSGRKTKLGTSRLRDFGRETSGPKTNIGASRFVTLEENQAVR
jgi:hypothetical protein